MMPRKAKLVVLVPLAVVLAAVSFVAGFFCFHLPPAGSAPAAVAQADSAASRPATTDAPRAEGPGAPATIAASATQAVARGLVITKAIYGDLPDGPSTDVTAKVASLVREGTLSVGATNDNFGDPAGGIVKTLRVDYTLNGVADAKTVEENRTLKIAAAADPARPSKLVIRHAVYGDLPNGTAIDVTQIVRDLVTDDSLAVDAENGNFTDPAVGITKKLRVDFTFQGKEDSKTVDEGEKLTISNLGF